MPRRKARYRARTALRKWYRRTTESPKIKLFGLSVSILLVVLKLGELIHQLVSVVT
jgi:hypothetical protein